MSENILWELELLKRAQALERTVFLVEGDQIAGSNKARSIACSVVQPRPLSSSVTVREDCLTVILSPPL